MGAWAGAWSWTPSAPAPWAPNPSCRTVPMGLSGGLSPGGGRGQRSSAASTVAMDGTDTSDSVLAMAVTAYPVTSAVTIAGVKRKFEVESGGVSARAATTSAEGGGGGAAPNKMADPDEPARPWVWADALRYRAPPTKARAGRCGALCIWSPTCALPVVPPTLSVCSTRCEGARERSDMLYMLRWCAVVGGPVPRTEDVGGNDSSIDRRPGPPADAMLNDTAGVDAFEERTRVGPPMIGAVPELFWPSCWTDARPAKDSAGSVPVWKRGEEGQGPK